MSIDIAREHGLSFRAAAAWVVKQGWRDTCTGPTVWRWAAKGIGGVRLERIQAGGKWRTSVEALQRFFDRLTDQGERKGFEKELEAAPSSVARQELEARQRLRKAGIL